MTLDTLTDLLFWATVINIGLLLFWFVIFALAKDFVYKLHGKWYSISREHFDAIHYAAIAFYKLSIFMFFLIPWIVLRFIL